MPRGRKDSTSPANLFIAQDIRPRDLSERRWKRPMERLAGRITDAKVGGVWWGRVRLDALHTARAVFVWLRSGR
jgi:hypothetical protein